MVLPTRMENLSNQTMIATPVLVPKVKGNVQQMSVLLLLPVNIILVMEQKKHIKLMMNGKMTVMIVTVSNMMVMLITNVAKMSVEQNV